MSRTARLHFWSLCWLAGSVQAGDGLSLPDGEPVWPQWQARIELTTPVRSLSADYYLDTAWLAPGRAWQGGVRATSGLLLGQSGTSGGAIWPYFGVGYTGLSRRSGWGFVADLGLVVQTTRDGHTSLGAFAHQPSLDDTLRDIRLSPMVQLGVRYSF